MRHFDAWVIRDPYSIWHYYSTGRRWQDTVRDLIHERKICSPTHTPSSQPPSQPPQSSIPPHLYHQPPLPQSPSINPQSTSPLFTTLPPEIRHIIWSYVFGADTLHLVQIKNKIRHVRCSAPPSSPTALTQHRHCCPTTTARWRVHDGRDQGHSDNLLYPHTHDTLPEQLSSSHVALLRSCKAVYVEAVDYLYTQSTFDVDDLYTFIAFAQSLSPRSLAVIRNLTLQWMPVWTPLSGQDHKGSIYAHTHSDALWKELWARVASLPSLKELRVSLDLGRFTGAFAGGGPVVLSGNRLPLVLGEPWLWPLLNVRGLAEFELAVTAKCDAASRGVIENGLCRDVGVLRDQLRAIMCADVGVGIGMVKGLDWGVDESMLEVFEELMSHGMAGNAGRRLAIAAA